MSGCMPATVHMQRSEDNLFKQVQFSIMWDLGTKLKSQQALLVLSKTTCQV